MWVIGTTFRSKYNVRIGGRCSGLDHKEHAHWEEADWPHRTHCHKVISDGVLEIEGSCIDSCHGTDNEPTLSLHPVTIKGIFHQDQTIVWKKLFSEESPMKASNTGTSLEKHSCPWLWNIFNPLDKNNKTNCSRTRNKTIQILAEEIKRILANSIVKFEKKGEPKPCCLQCKFVLKKTRLFQPDCKFS